MRLPLQIAGEVERLGRLILQGEVSYDEAVDALEVIALKDEHRLFARDILRRALRQQIRTWIQSHLAVADEEEDSRQQPLPFPDLRPLLEIAPGTFRHQNACTARDWNAVVTQAQTKADNAAGYLERVIRARDLAVAMLAGRPNATLADIS